MEKSAHPLREKRFHPPITLGMLVGSWLCALILAAMHLPVPLTGDQALFMYGARSIAAGGMLYLDFWDVKQPGIYLFYLLAGELFSFSEIGLHILEAIWLVLAAWFGYRIARIACPRGAAPAAVPVLTMGTYFLSVSAWHMSQPDGLVCTPIAASIWAICDRRLLRNWKVRWLAAGVFAGIAATFKITILLVPLAALFSHTILRRAKYDVDENGVPMSSVALYWLSGLALPFSLMALWFWNHGALSDLLWTTFKYPLEAFAELDHHTEGIRSAVGWFVDMALVCLPLTAIGALWSLREIWRRSSAGIPGVLMIVWGGAGALTIFLQYHYWWAFHLNQFFVPMGVLAGLGLHVVLDAVSWKKPLMAIGSLLIVGIAVGLFSLRVVDKVSLLAKSLKHPDGLALAYAEQLNPASIRLNESVSAALQDKTDGGLYVFGDPRLLLAARRQQPVRHNGWALEIMTASQWEEFAKALETARPLYVYVSAYYEKLLPERAPKLSAWLHANYNVFSTDSFDGHWYELASLR